jgi:hypothetical protein
MKIKFLLVLFISTLSYGQITLNEMKTILNKDIDYIETFALNRGYSFKEVIKDENEEGVGYVKGVGKNTKHLSLSTNSSEIGTKHIFYQTSIETDYLLIKKQLIEQGFKLNKTYDIEGVLYKEYSNRVYKIRLMTGGPDYPEVGEFYAVRIGFNK